DDEGLRRAVEAGQIDIVVTAPPDYLGYVHRLGLGPPLLTVEMRVGGHSLPVIGGTVLALASRKDLGTLADIEGRRVAIASLNSLGAYQAQAHEMLQHGLRPPQGQQLVVTGLPQSRGLQALRDGRVDALFATAGMLERWEGQGLVAPGELRVIGRHELPGFPVAVSTRLHPGTVIAAMPRVSPALLERIVTELLEMSVPAGDASAIEISGFALPQSMEPVAELMRELGVPPYQHRGGASPGELWRDHRPGVIAFLSVFSGLLLLLLLLMWVAVRLRLSREHAESGARALASQGARLKSLLDSIPDLVWLKDPSGRYIFCNPGFAALHGRSEAELEGLDDETLFGQGLAEVFRERERRAVTQGGPVSSDEWLGRGSGMARVLYQTTRTPVRGARGELLGVLGVARDITAMRDLNARLDARIRQQACLYAIFRATEDPAVPLPRMLDSVVRLIPSAWSTPGILAAELTVDGECVSTPGYRDPLTAVELPVRARGRSRGRLTVGYLQPPTDQADESLDREERELLEAIAARIGSVVARREIEAREHEREETFRV
ncbi:MAG: PhnD/SsuA/transferrin family substrate-binding protein, partial [Gammaproteobacteria bacterium]